ncbi:RNA polymerase sigma factor [Alteromonas gilva]|uniref:RNA polymerase sigma factor n=1 Tax=Alteromonas gilva TaxID=2987522 RepID=A0ABT5KYI9_9ALTE|nr:RNA polymerase sigma factor [Alteromonas gilva]MDC8829840.1 RNA polymerase sigma factor [Alteromonas gilva]
MTASAGTIVNAEKAFTQQQILHQVRLAQGGDTGAYRQLYERFVGQVYALSYRLTGGDAGIAEDATQEVFVQVWLKLANFSEQSQFSTWLHSVAANITISYLRKQRGWLKRMFTLEAESEQQLQAEAICDLSELDKCIVRLPERARLVFVLHAIEGYRHEDIARMLKMAVGTSKAQYHRARKLLEEWLGEQHD